MKIISIRTKYSVAFFVLCLGLVFAGSGCKVKKAEYPERDITNVLIYPAGGGTDTCNRVVCAEMAKILGVNINIVNKTGGVCGSAGMNYAYSSPHDGYTLCGLSEASVSASVQGGFDKRMDVWDFFIIAGSPCVLSITPKLPFKDLKELIEAAKAKPGSIRAGASCVGCIHHINLLALEDGTGAKFNYIPYPGSGPAQNAAMTGEVSVVIGSVSEQAQLILSGRLRPLAILIEDSYSLGDKNIPSAFDYYPALTKYMPITQAISFAVAADTPPEVKSKLETAFKQVVETEKFRKWAKENYYVVSGKTGKEAAQVFSKLESRFAWTMWDLGGAKVNPAKINIPKP